jgi:hypothetical protein
LIESLALFFFLWFVASLRETARGTARNQAKAERSMLATVVVVGGSVFVALLMAGVGLAAGVRTMSADDYHHQVYPGIIQAANAGSYAILGTSSAALAAMIVAFSVAILYSRVLPVWVAWFGFLAGATAVASSTVPRLWDLTLLWLLLVSVLLFLSSQSEREFGDPSNAALSEP